MTGVKGHRSRFACGWLGGRRAGIALAAAVSLAALLISCGGEEAPGAADEAAPPADTSAPETPPSADGAQAARAPVPEAQIFEGEVPEGYPKDVPLPPAAEPTRSMLIPGRGGIVAFTSTEKTPAVMDHFKTALPEQGWTVDEAKDEEMRSLILASKDTRKVTVIVSDSSAGSNIAVTVQEAE